MERVLILGGTGWLSGHIARRWVEEGAAVTCLARGGRPAPDGAELVTGDRDEPGAYDDVDDREWDEIVDVSSRAAHVASAVAALADGAAHWTYVSTLSVYADPTVVGADESAALVEPAAASDEYDYAREKSAAEAAVRGALEARAAIVRPGLIVGPGDPSDRFGYWVGRFALAGSEPALVPEATDGRAQVIDVEDLADFVVSTGAARWTGVVNAIGDSTPLADVLTEARRVAGHTGPVVAAADDWLVAHEVAYWAGPRSLPLWLPPDMPGFAAHANARFRELGGATRPLADTLERTLVDERTRGLDRDRRAGLTRVDELALIAERA